MKMDFKRFLSSLLAFVMTFSAVTIGNVSSISAEETTEMYVINDTTETPSWFNTSASSTETIKYDGTFEEAIFEDGTGVINGKKAYDISDCTITVAGNATAKIYAFRQNDNAKDGEVSVSTSNENSSVSPNILYPPGRKATDVKALEIAITGASDGSETTISFGNENKTTNYIYAVELTYDNENGGGDVDPTYTYSVDIQNKDVLAIPDNLSSVHASTGTIGTSYGPTTATAAQFDISYNGPDYKISDSVSLTADTPTSVYDVSTKVSDEDVIKTYTVSGTVRSTATGNAFVPTGTLSVAGQDIIVNDDGTYSISGVTYWYNGETAKITYADTAGDSSTMDDYDLSTAFMSAYETNTTSTTFTVEKQDLEITVVVVPETAELVATDNGNGSYTYDFASVAGSYAPTESANSKVATASHNATDLYVAYTEDGAVVTDTSDEAGITYTMPLASDFSGNYKMTVTGTLNNGGAGNKFSLFRLSDAGDNYNIAIRNSSSDSVLLRANNKESSTLTIPSGENFDFTLEVDLANNTAKLTISGKSVEVDISEISGNTYTRFIVGTGNADSNTVTINNLNYTVEELEETTTTTETTTETTTTTTTETTTTTTTEATTEDTDDGGDDSETVVWHKFWVGDTDFENAEATYPDEENDKKFFGGISSGTKQLNPTEITIDDRTYTFAQGVETKGSITFTIPEGYKATFYVVAASSGGSARKLTLTSPNIYSGGGVTAASSSVPILTTFPSLIAGEYTLSTDNTAKYVFLGVKLTAVSDEESTTTTETTTETTTTTTTTTTETTTTTTETTTTTTTESTETTTEDSGSGDNSGSKYVHNFSTDGKNTSDFVTTITGNLTSSSASYEDLTFTQGIKIETSTSIVFNAPESGELILVLADGGAKIKIDGDDYTADANGVVTVSVKEGEHSISKNTGTVLYYMELTTSDESGGESGGGSGGGESTTFAVKGSFTGALIEDITLTLTVDGETYTTTLKAGSKDFTFSDVPSNLAGKNATISAEGYTLGGTTTIKLTESGANFTGLTATKNSSSSGTELVDFLDVTDINVNESSYVDGNKMYVFVTDSGRFKVDADAMGDYTLPDGYTYKGERTYTVTQDINFNGSSTTSGDTSKYNRVVVFNLPTDGTVVAGAYGSTGRTVYIYAFDTGTQTIGDLVESYKIETEKTLETFAVGLEAGTYAIAVSGGLRVGFVGATVPFGTVPGAAEPLTVNGTLAEPLAEDMQLVLTVDNHSYNITVPAGSTTFEFTGVLDSQVGKTATLTSNTHDITGTLSLELAADVANTFTIDTAKVVNYLFTVDTTGLAKTPAGSFTFKDADGKTLSIGDEVNKGSVVNVYYNGTDYSFTGGYTSMTMGTENSSQGITIDTSTDPDTMVLTLADCSAFNKELESTHVYMETLVDTETRKEWGYFFESGNYEPGYLPLSEIVADSGVINPSGTRTGHGPNNEYAGEAYGGIDTKDSAASNGENKVIVTPAADEGALLKDTNGDGDKGLITTLYMPLPENIKTGKVTVSSKVYTSASKSQWTMLQIGDIGGIRTSKSADPTVYGLRLGNGSKDNSPYASGANPSGLFDVMGENESSTQAVAGWMEFTITIDFDTKEITLAMGADVITASFANIPNLADGSAPSVGYLKAMTDTKNTKDVRVGDTTIVWEPTLDKTTSAVTLAATNKTTDYYTAVVYDSEGKEVTRVNISSATEDNETAEEIALGELPVGTYTIQYVHNGSIASTYVNITTNQFEVTQEDVDAGEKTVETEISYKTTSSPVINVEVTNDSTEGTDYPARIFVVNSANQPILITGMSATSTDSYVNVKVDESTEGTVTTYTLDFSNIDGTAVELPDGTYSFIIESGHNLISTVTQTVQISAADGINEYTGAVTLTDADFTKQLVPVPWNETDDDFYVFGTNNNNVRVDDGTYTGETVTDGPINGDKYFYFDYNNVVQDDDGITLPDANSGNKNFITFIPENDSKLVLSTEYGITFAPEVYSTSDMSANLGDVTGVNSTGTHTYFVKAGITYTIYGISTAVIEQLQLRPITAADRALDVVVDAINKTEKDAVVNIYDGNVFVESITVPANTTTATNIALTKKYNVGKTYTFRTADNTIKIESQEFSIPEDATGTYTAKLTLGQVRGLRIVLRNAPQNGFNMTFNGITDTYLSGEDKNYHEYDVVAGQSYVFSTSNDAVITKWPNEEYFTYDDTDGKLYIHIPEDYEQGMELYFDYTANAMNILYDKDNSTSVKGATIGFGQYGFGEVKTAVCGNDARTALEYAGVIPSLTEFKRSYQYAVEGNKNLGYHADGVDSSQSVGYITSGLNDNRLLINANTDSYVQFTFDPNDGNDSVLTPGLCKVDKSIRSIVVTDVTDDTTVTQTTSGVYSFFEVIEGHTYKITGDTTTTNTHLKSVRIFAKANYFHFENIQSVGKVLNDPNTALKTNNNVTVTAEASLANNPDSVVQRLFGYLENEAVNDEDLFESIAYIGWTFVPKNAVDTYEAKAGEGAYNPNMTKAETAIEDEDGEEIFSGVDPSTFKNLQGDTLYEAVYDYSKDPVNGVYSYLTGYGSNGPLHLRHIAANEGVQYYAYAYTVYKTDTSYKAYTLSDDEKYGINGTENAGLWRYTLTF